MHNIVRYDILFHSASYFPSPYHLAIRGRSPYTHRPPFTKPYYCTNTRHPTSHPPLSYRSLRFKYLLSSIFKNNNLCYRVIRIFDTISRNDNVLSSGDSRVLARPRHALTNYTVQRGSVLVVRFEKKIS